MTFWILLALGLYFVQTLLPPMFQYVLRPDPQVMATLGPRDTPPEMSRHGARAARALRNATEGFILFLPLAVLNVDAPGSSLLGAQIFVLARIAYVPAYILGIPVVRSAIWTLSLVGLGLMAAAVAGG